MVEIALHILDLIENSINARASIVRVTVNESPSRDLLEIRIEDNGAGLGVTPEQALDPFYTTKPGKRVGLGLALFAGAAERAGGRLKLGQSVLGGVCVDVVMQLSHIDRAPLGDLPTTFSSVVCTNPDLDLQLRFLVEGAEREVRVKDLDDARQRGTAGLTVARKVSQEVKTALASVGMRS